MKLFNIKGKAYELYTDEMLEEYLRSEMQRKTRNSRIC